jgi:hypothetical protein
MALDRSIALDILNRCRISRDVDFHALDSTQVDLLAFEMRATSYRATKNRSGSAVRYFHAYLIRLINRND